MNGIGGPFCQAPNAVFAWRKSSQANGLSPDPHRQHCVQDRELLARGLAERKAYAHGFFVSVNPAKFLLHGSILAQSSSKTYRAVHLVRLYVSLGLRLP